MTAAVLGAEARAEVKAVRFALSGLFLLVGLFGGSWGVMIPFAKAQLGLTHGDLGLIMLSGGIGGLCAMPLGGILMSWIGSRMMIAVGGAAMTLAFPGILLAPSGVALAAVLFLLGLSVGQLDIGLNAQAVIVEERGQRPAMSSFHGFFSGGGLIVPLVVGALLDFGLTAMACLWAITAVIAVMLIAFTGRLYPHAADRRGASGGKLALPHGRAWLIGLYCMIFYMAEGTIFDWSALLLRDYRSFDPAWAGLGLASFSLTMTAVRFVGDRLVARVGPERLALGGAILAAAGMLLAVSVPSGWVGILGFAIFGLGAGNIVPIAFSAAGRLPGASAGTAIAALATMGACGTLAGPASIGFVSDAVGLPVALGLVAAITAATGFLARYLRPGA
jgi:fucose permease